MCVTIRFRSLLYYCRNDVLCSYLFHVIDFARRLIIIILLFFFNMGGLFGPYCVTETLVPVNLLCLLFKRKPKV